MTLSSKTISFSVSRELSDEERDEKKDEILSEFDNYNIEEVKVAPSEVEYTIIEKEGKDEVRCKATTDDGDRCKRMTSHESGYCYQHR